jgi:DNA-binding beta-propeller fold protein YncE
VLLPAALLLWAAPGAGAASRIFWGNCDGKISFANLNDTGNGGDLNTSGVSPNCPQGTAMDLLSGKIYWADANGNTISFANLDNSGGGGNLDTSGATTPSTPLGVATDPATGKIYWGNLFGPLSFANLDDTGSGSDLSTSGATPPNFVVGIAIDPATGKIYWTNGNDNTISFANLDGTGGGGDLNTTGATVNNPQGLAIDPANGKVYWANDSDNTHPISFANLNDTGHGGNLDVSGAAADGAEDVAIDPEAGKLYWANFNGDTISFANLNGSGGGGELNTTGASAPSEPGGPSLLKVPLATARPAISGGSTVGSTLSCSTGTWAPDLIESFLYQQPVSFSYKWRRNGGDISGATSNSITASRAGTYTCVVTATNQAGSTKKATASDTVS